MCCNARRWAIHTPQRNAWQQTRPLIFFGGGVGLFAAKRLFFTKMAGALLGRWSGGWWWWGGEGELSTCSMVGSGVSGEGRVGGRRWVWEILESTPFSMICGGTAPFVTFTSTFFSIQNCMYNENETHKNSLPNQSPFKNVYKFNTQLVSIPRCFL